MKTSIMRNKANNVKNKETSEMESNKNKKGKKMFDKKTYRLQKYSNKYKLNQWNENRKKAALRGLHKELKKDQQNLLNLKDRTKNVDGTTSQPKNYAVYKAKKEQQRKKEEKERKMKNAICVKEEREEALKKYKEKKMHTYKALSKHTKKGQPVMKDRIELLLEKIKQNLT